MKAILYHGSPVEITKFEIQNSPTGSQQEGSGIYLTTSFDDAATYGRYIHKVEWSYTKGRLISDKQVSKNAMWESETYIRHICKKSPNWQDAAMNWDEDPVRGLGKFVSQIIEYSDSMLDIFQSVDGDFFDGEGKLFCKSMRIIKDGFILEKANGVKHIIAFNDENIKILEIMDNEKKSLAEKIIKESQLKENKKLDRLRKDLSDTAIVDGIFKIIGKRADSFLDRLAREHSIDLDTDDDDDYDYNIGHNGQSFF